MRDCANFAHARCVRAGRSHAADSVFDYFVHPIGSGVSRTNSVHDGLACFKRRLPSRRRIRRPVAPSPPRTCGPHRPRLYSRSPYNSRIATICPARWRDELSSRAQCFLSLRDRVHVFTLHVSRRLFNYNILRAQNIATPVGSQATISTSTLR